MPRNYWDDAVVTAIYLMNRMPYKVLDFQTPIQALSKCGLLVSLDVLPLFISIKINVLSLIHVLFVVFFWNMLNIKRDAVVTILPLGALMLLWMSLSWSLKLFFFPGLHFSSSGGVHSEEQN